MKIPITFLGTGQAIPTAKRNHSAILVKYKDENILFDCGEGTQRQFRKAKINPCKITRLLITHWHGDHVLGIPGLLQTLALNNYNKTLYVYGPKGTSKFMDLMYKLFVYKEKIKMQVKEISSGKVFDAQDFSVEALQMKHGAPTIAYSLTEKDKKRIDKAKLKMLKIPQCKELAKLLEGKGVIIKCRKLKPNQLVYKEKGRKISLILDTAINPNCYKIAKTADLLICESTYMENEAALAKEYKHLTAKQAGQIAKKAKTKKLIITHLSQRYENKEKKLLNEAKKIFKNASIVEDLDKIEI